MAGLFAGSLTFGRLGVASAIPLQGVLVAACFVALTLSIALHRTDPTRQTWGFAIPLLVSVVALVPLLASLAYSEDPDTGLAELGISALMLVYLGAVFLVAGLGGATSLIYIARTLALVACAYLVVALLFSSYFEGRLALPGGGPNVFGRVMALGVVTVVWSLWTRTSLGRGFSRTVLIICAIALTTGLVLSGSRGALLSAVVGVLLLLPWMVNRWATIFWTGIATVGALFVLRQWTSLAQYWQGRFVELTVGGVYLSGREGLYAQAWAIVTESPFLGGGYGTFGARTLEPGSYPHNIFLEYLASAGVLGLIILLVCMALLLLPALPLLLKAAPVALYIALAAVVLVGAQVSGGVMDFRLFWLFAGLAYAGAKVYRTSSPTRAQSAT